MSVAWEGMVRLVAGLAGGRKLNGAWGQNQRRSPEQAKWRGFEPMEERILLATQTIANVAGPILAVVVGDQGDWQVYHSDFETTPTGRTNGQIFPPGSAPGPADAGFFIRLTGTNKVYGHTGGASGGTGAANYAPVSNVLTQSGSTYSVVTIDNSPAASPSPFQVTQTTTYTAGDQFFRQDVTVKNTGTSLLSFDGFDAADIYLAQSDQGFPFLNAQANAVGGEDVTHNYRIFNEVGGTVPATSYQEASYAAIWAVIGGGATSDFNNTTNPAYIDNGAGHEWKALSVAAGQSVTLTWYWAFGNITSVEIANAAALNATAQEGKPVGPPLASFTSTGAASATPPSATIDWGDGSVPTPGGVIVAPASADHSNVPAGATLYYIGEGNAPHIYRAPGVYTATVSIGGTTLSSIVTVNPVALAAAGYYLNTDVGTAISGAVGEFTDADAYVSVSNYTATIDWGDNTVTVGQISAVHTDASVGTTYHVSGTHTYDSSITAPQAVTINVTRTDTGNVVSGTGQVFFNTPAVLVAAPLNPANPTYVSLLDQNTGLEKLRLTPVGSNFSGPIIFATGNLTTDGFTNIVTAIGPGGGPWVNVYSGKDGSLLRTFAAFDPNSRTGVNLAVADVLGTGLDQIIVSQGAGGTSEVKVFDPTTYAVVEDFMAYDASFAGGVRIAAADIGGRGYADIITAPGPSSSPQPIKYFDGQTDVNYYSFFPVGFNMSAGAYVAAADVYGDGRADVLVSAGSGAQSMIINYFTTTPASGTTPAGTGIRVTNYLPFDNANSNGVHVSTADYELSGKPDIVLLTHDNTGRTLEKIINPLTALTVYQFPA